MCTTVFVRSVPITNANIFIIFLRGLPTHAHCAMMALYVTWVQSANKVGTGYIYDFTVDKRRIIWVCNNVSYATLKFLKINLQRVQLRERRSWSLLRV